MYKLDMALASFSLPGTFLKVVKSGKVKTWSLTPYADPLMVVSVLVGRLIPTLGIPVPFFRSSSKKDLKATLWRLIK